mgnify:CR=1 FL=1
MIYFLTDWNTELEKLESNIIFNTTKLFNTGEIDTKIINLQMTPFLSYYVNRFEFYNSNNIESFLDILPHQFACVYAPLTMNDLQFPKSYEKTYTRTNVLLSKDGVIKGKVFFNQFGFVSQVCYYSDFGKEVQTFSEKGYILFKEFFDSKGNFVEKQVLDEGGQLILTEYDETVVIADVYRKYFLREIYASFKEFCIELVNRFLIHFNPEKDRIVIDGTSRWLIEIAKGIKASESIISIFSGDLQECISNINQNLEFITKGKQIITDQYLLKDIDVLNLKNKVEYMPFFPTRLTLGESNRYLEQFVYWEISSFDAQIKQIFQEFLRIKLTYHDVCLIIKSENSLDLKYAQDILEAFILKNFETTLTSSEFELVKHYYEALENDEMTPVLRDLFHASKKEKQGFSRIIEAYLFFKGITYRHSSSVKTLTEDFNKVRIFVDQRDKGDFFNHSLATSSGIPIISKRPSPYLFENKNGMIIGTDNGVIEVVESYLKNTDKWNQNLVESVGIIEQYSPDGLLNRWKEVMN